jgi:hypothetical protein
MIRTIAPIITQSSLPNDFTIFVRTQQRKETTNNAITYCGIEYASNCLVDILLRDSGGE